MLIGHYIASITTKRRTVLPSEFRKVVGKKIIITRWYEGCLVIIGEGSFTNIVDKLVGERKLITKPIRDTERFILGSAYQIEVDSQGRFIVPKVLTQFAKFKDKIVFVGLNDRVEIWDQSTWDRNQPQLIASSSSNIEKLAE